MKTEGISSQKYLKVINFEVNFQEELAENQVGHTIKTTIADLGRVGNNKPRFFCEVAFLAKSVLRLGSCKRTYSSAG
jgi:hypothetical protein